MLCALVPTVRVDARRVRRSHYYLCGLWRHGYPWRMYALLFPRPSGHDMGMRSYVRSLHTSFTRARWRARRSAWLLGPSTWPGRISQKPASRASLSVHGHIRRPLCASGAMTRAGASSSRRTTTRAQACGGTTTSSP